MPGSGSQPSGAPVGARWLLVHLLHALLIRYQPRCQFDFLPSCTLLLPAAWRWSTTGARQAVLQERYGFTCSCIRCQEEQQTPQQLQQLLQHVYLAVMQVSGALALMGC
jgi:hypothetical protein